MSEIDDGGPAFPGANGRSVMIEEGASDVLVHTGGADGMSLRDWFAAHAPNPPASWWGDSIPDCAGYAQWNFQYADAMIAARKATTP